MARGVKSRSGGASDFHPTVDLDLLYLEKPNLLQGSRSGNYTL